MPWPGNDRVRAVREKLRDVIAALDNEHLKWRKDEEQAREKRERALARFQAEAQRLRQLEILSEEATRSAVELAQKLAAENTSDKELPLPEKFTEALQRMMDDKAEARALRALRRAEERAAAAEAAFKQTFLDKESAGEGAEGQGVGKADDDDDDDDDDDGDDD